MISKEDYIDQVTKIQHLYLSNDSSAQNFINEKIKELEKATGDTDHVLSYFVNDCRCDFRGCALEYKGVVYYIDTLEDLWDNINLD